MRFSWSVRTFLGSKIVLAVACGVLVFLTIVFVREFSRQYVLQKHIEELQAQLATVEGKNQELGQLLQYLETDSFAEEEARLKLGLKKPGESVVVIDESTALPSPARHADQLSPPGRWWCYFFCQSPPVS